VLMERLISRINNIQFFFSLHSSGGLIWRRKIKLIFFIRIFTR
jgi:hypothetical protein